MELYMDTKEKTLTILRQTLQHLVIQEKIPMPQALSTTPATLQPTVLDQVDRIQEILQETLQLTILRIHVQAILQVHRQTEMRQELTLEIHHQEMTQITLPISL